MPADFAAQCREFADNDKLDCGVRLAAAVDPEAFLDRQVPAATAEIPRRRPARAQDCAHSVSSDSRLDSGREMEAHRIRRRLADFPAPLWHELIGPAQLFAVIAQHQAALVNQAEGANIAVVARLEPTCVIVLATVDG